MKLHLFFAILAAALYFYFRNSPPTPVQSVAARPPARTVSHTIVVAAAPSYHDRWKMGPNAQTDLKTGPNAQTDLKIGPNAQTDFEPFAPGVQSTWNQTPGYSIVAGATLRVR